MIMRQERCQVQGNRFQLFLFFRRDAASPQVQDVLTVAGFRQQENNVPAHTCCAGDVVERFGRDVRQKQRKTPLNDQCERCLIKGDLIERRRGVERSRRCVRLPVFKNGDPHTCREKQRAHLGAYVAE